MALMQQKSFSQPDETRIFTRGELKLVELGVSLLAVRFFSPDGPGPPVLNLW